MHVLSNCKSHTMDEVLLAGNNLAMLVAVSELARRGRRVRLCSDAKPLGGHFAGMRLQGQGYDIGMVMLEQVLHVPIPEPVRFTAVLALSSLMFLALVFALIRVFGDLGRVLAVLLLVVQVSAAGALLPIELSDAAFQAVHPYLPLTWVLRAFRVALFGAFEGELALPLAVVVATALAALAAGIVLGRWRPVPPEQWRPPLDIE